MKKLGDPSYANKGQHNLKPNIVAAVLKSMGKLSVNKEQNRTIKMELKNHRKC